MIYRICTVLQVWSGCRTVLANCTCWAGFLSWGVLWNVWLLTWSPNIWEELRFSLWSNPVATVSLENKITHLIPIPYQSEDMIGSSLAPLCVFFPPRGVAICFLIVGLLLTLTALSYLFGTALQMVCNDVSPPDYVMFREVTDKPSLWGGRTLVGAITESTTGLSINVTLAGFLRYWWRWR